MSAEKRRPWFKTSYPGVRYRELDSTHGIRKNKYFALFYKLPGGRQKSEGVGRASDGWTAAKAADLLSEIRRNIRAGDGPQSLAEKRKLMEIKIADRERRKRESISCQQFFDKHYWPAALSDKAPTTCNRERVIFNRQVLPIIGGIPLRKVGQVQIQNIKSSAQRAGLAPRTVEHVLSITKRFFNLAVELGMVPSNPALKVKMPRFDNQRQRFLTNDESAALLDNLMNRSIQVYRMALTSLDSGLRLGEITRLQWADIDIDEQSIFVRDPKGKRNRHVPLTRRLLGVFTGMLKKMAAPPSGNQFVFSNRNGDPVQQLSRTFGRAVDDLGLNDGIDDRRQRVSFHSLRHTYASRLIRQGASLYVIKELLGHRDLATTERYSHLLPSDKKQAVAGLDNECSVTPIGQHSHQLMDS